MANRKISDLTALTTPASGDLLPIVDISEAAAANKNKKITIQSLFQGIPVNVGIGTYTPDQSLVANGGLSVIGAANFTGTNPSGIYISYESGNEGTIGARSIGTASSLVFKYSTTSSFAEGMRIDTLGRLLVATTSANPHTSGTYGIALNTNAGINIGSNNSHALIAARWNGNGEAIRLQRDNATVGTISVTTTATTYNTSSDYRLKENVTPVHNGITRLLQLKPSRFNFIADPDRTVDGFLAHEAQAVVPECVTGEKDAVDEDGNPVFQGIDQSKLVPLLTAALQEAIAKIKALETRLSALEAA
jgi:hypothetical protein